MLLLPAGLIQRLNEIAVVIEQPHPDQRRADIGRGLEVIACQDPQTSGILRQHLADAELGREIADRPGGRGVLGSPALVPTLPRQVILQICMGQVEVANEPAVAGQGFQAFSADLGQHLQRIATGAEPQVRIYRSKNLNGFFMPTPAKISGQLSQGA